ncbi:hypothetical protein EDC04DRAFT_3146358 [Pisolithus marmoratus]|nr:hypothetical protein EDC04DRAFT_3146358 [Pisolithus marmoratus]
MLVVHPASTCDICLDPYSITAEPVKSPHAIPCGHTFCLTCLRNLSPSACPLCRKTFRQDGNVKKLHVAEPPELDRVSEGAENTQLLSLLQRVALVSVEDAPDDEVVQVLAEVDEWLSQHSEDPSSNQPLRSAVAALRQHKALQDQTARDKAEHRRLRHELKHSMKSADHDLQTSRAEKESLLTQIEELKAVHSRCSEISVLQAKLDSLKKAQNTHISYRSDSNPLPPPPEPLPADRFPPFLRPGATDIDPLLDPISYPSYTQKSKQRTNLPNGSSSTPAPYVGSSHTHVQMPQISQPIAIRPKQGDAIQEDGRNRRLSSREDSYQHHRRYSSSSAHNRGVDSSTPDSRHKVNEIPRGGILRGPSPSVRVVVPSPYWSHQRPLVEERETHRRDRSDGSMGRRPISRNAPVQDTGTRAAAAYMHGYGAGYDSGYRIVSEPRTTSSSYGSNYSRGGRGFPVAESPDVGGLGLVNVPPQAPSGSVIIPEDYDATPVNRTSRLNRRHTTHVVGVEQPPNGSGGNSLPDRSPNGFSQSVHGQTATRTLDVPRRSTASNGTDRVDAALTRRQARVAPPITVPLAGDDVSPRSDTTWGTTSTDTLGLGEALVGLHNGGARGQRSVSDSAAVGRNGVDGYIANGGLDNETDGGSGTSTLPRVFAPTPIGTSALGLITEEDPSEGVRARRYNPSRTSATTQQTQVGHDHQSYHARRDERTRDHHRHVSQPTRTEVLSHAQEPGNALYLHFDASPFPHDNTRPIPSEHSDPHGRSFDIVAPTPIFGGPSVAHLWANRV